MHGMEMQHTMASLKKIIFDKLKNIIIHRIFVSTARESVNITCKHKPGVVFINGKSIHLGFGRYIKEHKNSYSLIKYLTIYRFAQSIHFYYKKVYNNNCEILKGRRL